jgi:hypothetical protein
MFSWMIFVTDRPDEYVSVGMKAMSWGTGSKALMSKAFNFCEYEYIYWIQLLLQGFCKMLLCFNWLYCDLFLRCTARDQIVLHFGLAISHSQIKTLLADLLCEFYVYDVTLV